MRPGMRPGVTKAAPGILLLMLWPVLLFVGGCERLVAVEPAAHEPMLVVHGLFEPGAPWHVSLTRSVALGDTADLWHAYVPNATVAVYAGEQAAGEPVARLVHQGWGTYQADAPPPEPGRTYALRVTAPGFHPAFATSTAPRPVPLSEGTFVDQAGGASAGPRTATLAFRLEDPAAEQNFYALRLFVDAGDTSAVHFRSEHAAIEQTSFREAVGSGGAQPSYEEVRFNDALFDGRPCEVAVVFDRMEANAYWLELRVLSEAFYQYAESRRLQEEARENPFADPVPVVSNVEGGLGVFAGYLRQRAAVAVLDEITPEGIAGSYAATYLRYAGRRVSPEEGRLTLTLTADRRVSGTLVLPETGEAPPLCVALGGTYAMAGNRLTFTFAAGSVLQGSTWVYRDGTLTLSEAALAPAGTHASMERGET